MIGGNACPTCGVEGPIHQGEVMKGQKTDHWYCQNGHDRTTQGFSVKVDEQFVPDEPQPIAKGEPKTHGRFDQTQLREAGHGQKIHRDYAAHYFRWGFVSKIVEHLDRVLDVGCGQDLPLPKILAGNPSTVPLECVSIDLNKLTKIPGTGWLTVHDETNVIEYLEANEAKFDKIIALEMIEHMHTCDARRMLKLFAQRLTKWGKCVVSTPVFNGKAAKNHIHEYTIPELQGFLEEAGFEIEGRYGTFMSLPDLRKVGTTMELELVDKLLEFYSTDVIANFLAPKYPDHSRNNLWVCKLREPKA